MKRYLVFEQNELSNEYNAGAAYDYLLTTDTFEEALHEGKRRAFSDHIVVIDTEKQEHVFYVAPANRFVNRERHTVNHLLQTDPATAVEILQHLQAVQAKEGWYSRESGQDALSLTRREPDPATPPNNGDLPESP
jgi:hypothetical protein